jgi:hypothetical protein
MLDIAGEALARNGRGDTGRGGLKEAGTGTADGAGADEVVSKAERIGS